MTVVKFVIMITCIVFVLLVLYTCLCYFKDDSNDDCITKVNQYRTILYSPALCDFSSSKNRLAHYLAPPAGSFSKPDISLILWLKNNGKQAAGTLFRRVQEFSFACITLKLAPNPLSTQNFPWDYCYNKSMNFMVGK